MLLSCQNGDGKLIKILGKIFNKKPLWNGEVEKSILIWKEQGIGDEIMYSSILPEIKKISKK